MKIIYYIVLGVGALAILLTVWIVEKKLKE